MTRNKSLFLVGTFFLIVIVSGNVFWRIFNQSNSEDFDKIKQVVSANLAKNQAAMATSTTVAAPNTLGASTKATAENESATSADTQNPDPSKEAVKPTDNISEKSPDDMADWKTYADEKNKLEFKYPSDAQADRNGDLVRVTQNNKTWKFRIYFNKDKTDLQTWYNKAFSDSERKNCILIDSTALKVGSYETKYVDSNSGATECSKAGYFSISGAKDRIIRVELGNETMENVNKILKTFIFQ